MRNGWNNETLAKKAKEITFNEDEMTFVEDSLVLDNLASVALFFLFC